MEWKSLGVSTIKRLKQTSFLHWEIPLRFSSEAHESSNQIAIECCQIELGASKRRCTVPCKFLTKTKPQPLQTYSAQGEFLQVHVADERHSRGMRKKEALREKEKFVKWVTLCGSYKWHLGTRKALFFKTWVKRSQVTRSLIPDILFPGAARPSQSS